MGFVGRIIYYINRPFWYLFMFLTIISVFFALYLIGYELIGYLFDFNTKVPLYELLSKKMVKWPAAVVTLITFGNIPYSELHQMANTPLTAMNKILLAGGLFVASSAASMATFVIDDYGRYLVLRAMMKKWQRKLVAGVGQVQQFVNILEHNIGRKIQGAYSHNVTTGRVIAHGVVESYAVHKQHDAIKGNNRALMQSICDALKAGDNEAAVQFIDEFLKGGFLKHRERII